MNDKTVDTVDILDDVSDSDLISREPLYTTGGVLENIAAPQATILESYNNRIFLAGLEDKNEIQFSKIRLENYPTEFNDTLTLNINPRGGDITALQEMDDKLVIFKENAIYFMSGEGPNNLGSLDNFIEPELVSTDVGCVDKNSVVRTPFGLMFKSNKGIYLLDRGLNTQYIGAAIEAFNSLTVSSAEVIPHTNQVRFTTSNGVALVYDYFVEQWVTYTNHKGLSATILGSNYYYVRTNGDLFKETVGIYNDNGSAIKQDLLPVG
jgi:hypothetical protein